MEATGSSAMEYNQLQTAQNSNNEGAYVLRDLIRDVPLSEHGEDGNNDVYITCVEAWGWSMFQSIAVYTVH